MKTGKKEKSWIGRIEKVDFPEWDLTNLDAKIDTGAYTSSLHCNGIEVSEDGRTVSFYVLDPSHPEFSDRRFTYPVHDVRKIRSSNGMSEKRIIIQTLLELAGQRYEVEFSLSDRSEMKYPVLLGRKFIQNRFVVDVSRKYIMSNE